LMTIDIYIFITETHVHTFQFVQIQSN